MPSATRCCRCRSRRARSWSRRPSRSSPTGSTEVERAVQAHACAAWSPTRRTSIATPPNSSRSPSPCARRRRPAATPARRASSSWSSWARATSSSTPTTRAWCRWSTGCGHYAFDQRASDIHLEPRREQGVIRFRIDGVLHPVYQMPMGVLNAMIARIKLLGRMDVVEKRRPQDGRIKTRNPRGDEVEMRLSTLPTAFGEKMVMRIFDPDTAVKDLDALGFSPHDAQRWEALVKRPHGIVLVTGPDRLGQDHHAVLHAQAHGHRGSERQHGRGPDRDDRAVASTRRRCSRSSTSVSPRAARADAAGPGHHHGRRDPRPADRRDGGAGGADRPPGVLDAAHQRRAVGGHAPDGAGRARLPDQRHACSACWRSGWCARCASNAASAIRTARATRSTRSSSRGRSAGGWQPYKPVGCVDCRMTGFLGRMGLYELLTVSEAFKEQVTPRAGHGRRCAARPWPTACGRCGWPARCAWPRASPRWRKCSRHAAAGY